MKVSKPSAGALSSAATCASAEVLDGQPAEQELIDLGVFVRLDDRMRHVVLLREEARRAEHDHRQAMQLIEEPAEMLGRKLGDTINIARQQRRHLLGDPGGALCAA